MSIESELTGWLIAWLLIAGLGLYLQTKRSPMRIGLVLAYVFGLWIIHWVAAVSYVLPWYYSIDSEAVVEGVKQSTYGVAALLAGSVFLAPLFQKGLKFPPPVSKLVPAPLRLAPMYIILGFTFYLVITPLLSGPTLTAVVSAGGNLISAGLVLKIWWSWKHQRSAAFKGSLLLALCLPFLTLITQGFIGYGTFALILICACVTSFYRPRWRVAVIGVLACYLGLSIYVTYMRDRNQVREVVWGGEAYSNRLQQLYLTFSEFEFFNIYDGSHLSRIDQRLNQSSMVGLAVRQLESGRVDFANGETVVDAALSLVPRVIWPDKPITGGSGNLVSTYTGIGFAEGTSVGVGQVMEFYINFGTIGVLVGFLVMGTIVGMLDEAAGERMVTGHWDSFILWFLPGICFLQVGGQLVEVTGSAAGAFVLALIIKRFVFGRPRAVDSRAARQHQMAFNFPVVDTLPKLNKARPE